MKKIFSYSMAALSLLFLLPNTALAMPPIEQSKMFDLTSEDTELIREKALHNNTVIQSFAFDHVNKHIYTVQLMAGGQQLPDEDEPVSGRDRDFRGDLTLTKLNLQGEIEGHMFLKEFGHGVSIGIETEGDNTFIWTETDAISNDGKHGWGSKLARFPFEDGQILHADNPQLEKFELIPDVDRTTVNIDMAYGNLTMRYRENGQFNFAVFPLDQVKQHNDTPIYNVAQPSGLGTFQGFASYGRFLYLLEGNAYGKGDSEKPTGNTKITIVDLADGSVVDQHLISAGSDLRFREPEGMSIYLPNPNTPNRAMLTLGFASTVSETNSAKLASIYGYDQLIRVEAQK
ncbi:Tat pathway signal sequence domain protein [Bacillaceae bacterium SIJ1]|uniref:phage baseplate protein n=1 Tax=Litoribacterium kuwaitense TaxID=1398745 RepID=UPI0013EAA564|nr:Tat pathway signal sequence domain protein [Litoribacterium kuwaitense]NGP45247.1 Tat pathway signal sequence domain protein [Litoribacterium kuwaitense]